MLAAGMLLAAGAVAPAAQDAARERLEALIAETNALEVFRVEFTLESPAKPEENTSVRIDYSAPDSIRLTMQGLEGSLAMGMHDDVLWMDQNVEGQDPMQVRLDFLDRGGPSEEVAAVLDDPFWRGSDVYEVVLNCKLEFDAESDKNDFQLSVSRAVFGGASDAPLLGWLDAMGSLDGELTLEDGDLVRRSRRAEMRVDGESGFLSSLTLTSAEGKEQRIVLARLDLDPEFEAGLFDVPAPDASARDASEQMRQALMTPQLLREYALKHVHRLLDEGGRRFDDEVHDALERFLVTYYDVKLARATGRWVESYSNWTVEYGDWLRSQLQAGVAREELVAAAATRRAAIVDETEQGVELMRSSMPADPEELADSADWRVIRDVENEVLDARFEALVVRPVLDAFDARVDEALGS